MKQADNNSMSPQKPTILAVASFGGHFVQLQRIARPLSEKNNIVFVTTSKNAKTDINAQEIRVVQDFSRSNPLQLFASIKAFRNVLKEVKPKLVISTGAAPGLAAIITAKAMGIPTIWVDSMANVERLSMCGRIASKVANHTFTQWPHLAKNGVTYHNSVL